MEMIPDKSLAIDLDGIFRQQEFLVEVFFDGLRIAVDGIAEAGAAAQIIQVEVMIIVAILRGDALGERLSRLLQLFTPEHA